MFEIFNRARLKHQKCTSVSIYPKSLNGTVSKKVQNLHTWQALNFLRMEEGGTEKAWSAATSSGFPIGHINLPLFVAHQWAIPAPFVACGGVEPTFKRPAKWLPFLC